MQNTSENYKLLYALPHHTEKKLVIFTTDGLNEIGTIPQSNIVELKTDRGLFEDDDFCIGCCVSGEIDAKFFPYDEYDMPVNIPRMAMVRVYIRLVYVEDDTQNSEWLPKGVFFIDTRKQEKSSGALKIHGFDAMLKTENLYTDESNTEYPVNDSVMVEKIATAIGVQVDSRLSNLITNKYQIGLPLGYSMREVLSAIATPYCVNFCISDDGKLMAVSAIAQSTEDDIPLSVVKDLDVARPSDIISKVILVIEDNTAIEVGDEVGRILYVDVPWGDEGMALSILEQVQNHHYQPYTAKKAKLDPSVELGDIIATEDFYSGIFHQKIDFSFVDVSDIEAPYENEIDNEYKFETPKNRDFERKLKAVGSRISQTATQILSEVYTKTETDKKISTSISEEAGKIRIELTNEINGINTYIRVEDGVLILGIEGQEIELHQSNNKVSFVDSSGKELAYIANDRFYMPNATVTETMRFGGYEADSTTNGIVWKWVGRG